MAALFLLTAVSSPGLKIKSDRNLGFRPAALSLHQFFVFRTKNPEIPDQVRETLIKKGRGLWPDEALTTCFSATAERQGANSIPEIPGQISQTSASKYCVPTYSKAHLIYRMSFFVYRKALPVINLLPSPGKYNR